MSSWQGRKSGRCAGKRDNRQDGAGRGKVPAVGGRGGQSVPGCRRATPNVLRLKPPCSRTLRCDSRSIRGTDGRLAGSPAAASGHRCAGSRLRDIPRADPRALSNSVGCRPSTMWCGVLLQRGGVSCCRGRPRSATIVSVPAPGFRAGSANVLSSFAFLLAALMAFRRWRQAGGDDIASLRLIIAVAAVGLRSFAFHALATLGAAVLDVGPIAVVICSAPFVALHRFLVAFARRRLLARLRGAVTQRLVPTGILNGSIGHVARSVRCAWWRPWRGDRAIAFAPNATAATGFRRGSRACTENWLVAAHDIGGVCHVAGITIN
jgi:hypothetical protein